MGVDVRLATAAEARQLYAHFTALARGDILTKVFVATQAGRIVGGASVSLRAARVDPVGPGCWIVSADGDSEAEAALLAALEQYALAAGAKALYSIHAIPDDSIACAAWQRLGFSACTDAEWFKVDVSEVATLVGRILDHRRESIRKDMTLGDWKPADDGGVAALHRRCFGGSPEKAARFVAGSPDMKWRREWSSVARYRGQVVGVSLIAERNDGRVIVATLAVDHAFRKSILVARLLGHSCSHGERAGVESAWVLVGERGRQVRRFVVRIGAMVDGRSVYFRKLLRER